MGLGRNSSSISADVANFPTGTPSELEEMGHNLADVHSCAIPNPNAGIKGCMYAVRCSKFFSRDKVGGFGPKASRPGVAGHGPEYVPYSIETAEGDGKEDFTACHSFMAGLFDRMLSSRIPSDITGTVSGETIRILGVAGKAQIVTYETLPQDPKLCNKNNNVTMLTEMKVITVPKHPRPKEMDPRWRERRARGEQDADDAIDDLMDDSVAGSLVDDVVGESDSGASAEPVLKRRVKP